MRHPIAMSYWLTIPVRNYFVYCKIVGFLSLSTCEHNCSSIEYISRNMVLNGTCVYICNGIKILCLKICFERDLQIFIKSCASHIYVSTEINGLLNKKSIS